MYFLIALVVALNGAPQVHAGGFSSACYKLLGRVEPQPHDRHYQEILAHPLKFGLDGNEAAAIRTYLSWKTSATSGLKSKFGIIASTALDLTLPGVISFNRMFVNSRRVHQFFRSLSNERIATWATLLDEENSEPLRKTLIAHRDEMIGKVILGRFYRPEVLRYLRAMALVLGLGAFHFTPVAQADQHAVTTMTESQLLNSFEQLEPDLVGKSKISILISSEFDSNVIRPEERSSFVSSVSSRAKDAQFHRVANLSDFGKALEKSRDSEVVVFFFHGAPSFMQIGADPFGDVSTWKWLEEYVKPGILKPGVKLIYVSCSFGAQDPHWGPHSYEDEGLFRLSRYLASGDFLAIASRNRILMGFETPKKRALIAAADYANWFSGHEYYELFLSLKDRFHGLGSEPLSIRVARCTSGVCEDEVILIEP